jgi:hypothetical protein
MKRKQGIYWAVLLIGLGSILGAYYVLESREPRSHRGPVDLETIRMRFDTIEHSVNSQMTEQLMTLAVNAQTEGKLTKEALNSLDVASEQACIDDMITDHELLTLADPISRVTQGKGVASRDDVRLMLSR